MIIIINDLILSVLNVLLSLQNFHLKVYLINKLLLMYILFQNLSID